MSRPKYRLNKIYFQYLEYRMKSTRIDLPTSRIKKNRIGEIFLFQEIIDRKELIDLLTIGMD